MKVTAPVTDYIPASVLTTLNDIVIRGAAAPERLAEIDWRGVDIASFNRDFAGDQAFTGAGFRPSLLILLLADDAPANLNYSIGFADGVNNFCMYREGAGPSITREITQCGKVNRGGGNTIYCVLASFDADGFTLTWTLGGACGTDGFYVLIP